MCENWRTSWKNEVVNFPPTSDTCWSLVIRSCIKLGHLLRATPIRRRIVSSICGHQSYKNATCSWTWDHIPARLVMLVKINRNVSFPSVRSLSFSLSNLEPSSGCQNVLILVDLLPLPHVVIELLRLLVLKRSASCTLQLQFLHWWWRHSFAKSLAIALSPQNPK